jgi:uncharacterized protein (DUF58 family)
MSGGLQLGLLLLLLIVSVALRQGLLFLVSLALLLTVGLAWLWHRACLVNVEYRRQLGQRRAFFGEEIELTIEIVNRKPLPLPWLAIHDEVPAALTPVLGTVLPGARANRALLVNLLASRPYERVRRHYRLRCDQRGEHTFGPVTLRSGDLFGLTSREETRPIEDSLLVYPKVVPLTRLGLPTGDPFGDRVTRQWLFDDPLRVVGVRAYAPGDSPRRIHWAASARMQSLQVKQFEPTTSYRLVIALNLNTAGTAWWWAGHVPDLLEFAVTIAASIATWAVEQRYQVGLLANGNVRWSDRKVRVPPSRDPGQLTHLQETLARLLPFATMPLEELLRRERSALPFGATVVVISAVLNEGILDSVQALQAAGHRVTLLRIGDHLEHARTPGVRGYFLGGETAWRALTALEIGPTAAVG